MRIYTEFIFIKTGRARTAMIAVRALPVMRDGEIVSYSRPCSRMMTIRIGSTHWK